jgi:uncharacterized protein (TIGR00269 family)
VYEREMAAYAIVRGIDYIYDECPHAIGSTTIGHKEMLNEMEEKRPGAKLQFYLSFSAGQEPGPVRRRGERARLHPCNQCGQPPAPRRMLLLPDVGQGPHRQGPAAAHSCRPSPIRRLDRLQADNSMPTTEDDLANLTLLGRDAKPSKRLETFPNHNPGRRIRSR